MFCKKLKIFQGVVTLLPSQFFIVAQNSEGTSLPTSLITVNTSSAGWDGKRVEGLPSPPHEIRTSASADAIELWWTAPVIASASDYHKYKITYGPLKYYSAEGMDLDLFS